MWLIIWTSLFFVSMIAAYISWRVNSFGLSAAWALLPGMGPTIIWAIISKYSQHIIFDSILYDVIIVLGFTGSLMIFKRNISIQSIFGLVFFTIGLILFRE